jgi:hypothetical protein
LRGKLKGEKKSGKLALPSGLEAYGLEGRDYGLLMNDGGGKY